MDPTGWTKSIRISVTRIPESTRSNRSARCENCFEGSQLSDSDETSMSASDIVNVLVASLTRPVIGARPYFGAIPENLDSDYSQFLRSCGSGYIEDGLINLFGRTGHHAEITSLR